MKAKKKTNVSDNSIAAYIEIKAKGLLNRQQTKVYNDLIAYGKPVTSRLLSKRTGIERSSMTRSLYDLERLNRVLNAYSAPCPETHKTVSWYQAVEQLEQSA